MPNKFNELLLKPDIIELYNEGITPNYGYLLNGRFEKDMIRTLIHLQTLSGNPITWEARELEYLFPSVSLQPKQAGTGDPSPENVRPISGYDSVTVNVRGKNLLGIVLPYSFDPSTRFSLDLNLTGTFVFSAQIDYTDQGKFSTALFSYVVNGSTQYISVGNSNGETVISGHLSKLSLINWSQSTGTINKIQLELGSTPTPYEPYQPGTTATLTLPETIYGGTVDAVTGVGSQEWEFVEFDGTENWIAGVNGDRKYFSCIISRNSDKIPSSTNNEESAKLTQKSSHFIILNAYTTDVENCIWIFSTPTSNFPQARLRSAANFTTVEELKSYLTAQAAAGTPVQAAYKLATPESFQATGNQQLTSLLGYNTIYTDGDSIALSRKARRLEV